MIDFKKNIRITIEALEKMEKELPNVVLPPITYSDFKNILKKTGRDASTISKWQKPLKGKEKPLEPKIDDKKIMLEYGIPLEWWLDIEPVIKDLKKNERDMK